MKLLYKKSVKDLPLSKHDYIHLTSNVTGREGSIRKGVGSWILPR